MKTRPNKKVFPSEEQIRLRDLAIEKIKSNLLPNNKIIKIILIGSSVRDNFGQYEAPGFRGNLFSDFDFIVFVENDYLIPNWLNKEPDGKPFPEEKLNLAYRNKGFIENKYDVEVFFIRKKSMNNSKIQALGEQAGISMSDTSKNKHIIIYLR